MINSAVTFNKHDSFVLHSLGILEVIFFGMVFLFIILLIVALIIFIIDAVQHTDAIRHNYPFIGRFRNWFIHLGVFFRVYFFSEDRGEMPFNRADRTWVYQATGSNKIMSAFGSTRNINKKIYSVNFVNATYPLLEDSEDIQSSEIVFGPNTANPYKTNKFFHISAMSYGALSAPAVQALSQGAKIAGILLDTGEGGIAPYHLDSKCDLVAEIGSAKYGFRNLDGKLDDNKLKKISQLEQVKMFSIKLGQGAKPGQGGVLPKHKITAEIAKIRGIRRDQDSISPNRWPEIANDEQLLDMINHIRQITQKPVGFKFVMGDNKWLDGFCKLIHKRGKNTAPDFIIIDGAEGGTGAAPSTLMDYVGGSILQTLPNTIKTLKKHNLKKQILVGCSGKLITPSRIAWALCIGADYVNSARGFMFSLGCIQAMRCHTDRCPTGVTTHNKRLQSGLDPQHKKHKVALYVQNIEREVGIIAHACGVANPRELNEDHLL